MKEDKFLKKSLKKKKKINNLVIDEDSDHPVHEEYAKEEPWKEG